MAMADSEGRTIENNGPLTPPSDERMDLELDQQHGALLQNGHPLKQSPLDKPSSVDHPARVSPVENSKSYLQNSELPLEGAVETSQETITTSQLPASSQMDGASTAFTSSAPEENVEHQISLENHSAGADPGFDHMSSAVQAPTSDLSEDHHPTTSQQAASTEEKNMEQDSIRDSKITNGLNGGETSADDGTSLPITPGHHKTSSEPIEGGSEPSAPNETATVTTIEIPHHPPVPSTEGVSGEKPIEPAPSPAAPSEAQSVGSTDAQLPPAPVSHDPSNDQVMQDASQIPAKMARPREEEEDVENEPALKRPKTNVEGQTSTDFKKPDLPEVASTVNGVQSSHTQTDQVKPPTGPQYKHMLRVLANVKRAKDSALFVFPVDAVKANVPNYYNIIDHPMDLTTIETKLKDRQYASIDAVVSDFNQIVQNTFQFNGEQHAVTQSAFKMRTSFENQMKKMPGPEVPENAPAEKKKRPSVSTTDKPMPPRRESRSSLPSSARSPLAPASPQTFALTPQGMPLIRRDSAADGRPKREIHPPAPRDLPYANQKPKKKKYYWELKFAESVLSELKKPRFAASAHFFLAPVDPVALNIPDYHKIIKKPMDLGTVDSKLKQGEYENLKEFEADVRLVFSNCYKFNPPNNLVHQAGKEIERVFDGKMEGKEAWIKTNTPASEPPSPGTSPEGSDEEDEDDEEEDEQASDEVRKLQEQIAAMAKKVELITQKKKSPPATSKKAAKPTVKSDKKAPKKAAPAPAAKAKSTGKPGQKKARYVTYEEKQDISNRINDLNETKMGQALKIIRDNMPSLKGEELELDIDELPNEVLLELHKFVKRHVPRDTDQPEKASPPVAPAVPSRKKNRPMGKTEQESTIKQLESTISKFDNPASVQRSVEQPAAAPVPSVAQDNDTSGDEVSEESEEE
ncbi:MAG: hypothetical protein Q9191_004300 [Dirinaria sp. TL-2023a]